jgi:hypothetical protein
MIYNIDNLVKDGITTTRELPDGRWVAAKPMRWPFLWRAKVAWKVLTGEYDALSYTGQK